MANQRLQAIRSLLLPLMLSGCADKLVLFPSTHPIHPDGARERTIPFGDGKLSIMVARSPGCDRREPAAFDLEFVGNGTRAEWVAGPVAQRWGDRPVEVWALNYPGYGRSTGPASLRSIPSAALAVYDAMAKAADGRPIFLGSHSLGTTVALYVARQREVKGMILLNPPPLRELILQHYGWWNLWVAASAVAADIPSELDSLANAAKVHVPAIFLSAAYDEVVPPKFHRMVYEAYAGPKRLVQMADAEHNTVPDPRTLDELRVGMDWLWPR